MRITIGGLPGSGTSTITRLLAKKIGLSYINGGQIIRQLADKAGVNLIKFTEMAEVDSSIDKTVDEQMTKHARENQDVILEGRLTGHFCQREKIEAFKVYLKAPLDIRVKRICQREKSELVETKVRTVKREGIENKRWKKHYDIDTNDLSIYDLVVDASIKTPQQIVGLILSKINQDNGFKARI